MGRFILTKKGYDVKQVDDFLTKELWNHNKVCDEQKQRIYDLLEENKALSLKLDEYKRRDKLVSNALVAAVSKAEEIEKVAKQKYDMELQSLKLFHMKWLSYYKQIIDKYPIDETLLSAQTFNERMAGVLDEIELDKSASQDESHESTVRDIIAKASASARAQEALETEKQRSKSDAESQYEEESKRVSGANASKGVNLTAVSEALAASTRPEPEGADRYEKVLASFSRDFTPIQSIKDYYDNSPSPAKRQNVDPRTGVDYAALMATPSESGFSLEEALHPTEDLEDIMKSLGLLED